jgi:hypothetical protein
MDLNATGIGAFQRQLYLTGLGANSNALAG